MSSNTPRDPVSKVVEWNSTDLLEPIPVEIVDVTPERPALPAPEEDSDA